MQKNTNNKPPSAPQSTRVFHKTILRFEVLSEGPLGDNIGLEEALKACDTGDCVGQELDRSIKVLGGKQVANALSRAGSDPGFFQLDDAGRDEDADESDGVN